MSTPIQPEAHIELELRLVAYLRSLQGGGNPLDDLLIVPAHSEQSLDGIPSYASIYAERSNTQPLWHGGLEILDVRMLVQTQADDTHLAVHNRRVAGFRAAFDLRNFNDRTVTVDGAPVVVSGFKTLINAMPGFGLSGWRYGAPPIEDGFDAKESLRQAAFRFVATCGLESV